MNSEKDYLGELAKLIPIIGAIILTFSAIRLSVFYFFYNINIFIYLEVIEIIPQSINSFLFVFFLGCFLFMLIKFLAVLILNESGIKEMYSQPTFLQSIKVYPFAFYLMIFFSSVIMLFIPLKLLGWIDYFIIVRLILYTLFTVVLVVILIEMNRNYYNKHRKFISKRFLYVILFSVYCIVLGAAQGAEKMYILKKNDAYLKNSITLEKKIINSTPTYYFIGRTNKYVFFFNEETNSSDAFLLNAVTHMTISE